MAFFSMAEGCGPGGEDDPRKAMRQMFGPAMVDQQIRQAISTCWMMLPEGKRNPQTVAKEIRRIVERALDDAKAFDLGDNEPGSQK